MTTKVRGIMKESTSKTPHRIRDLELNIKVNTGYVVLKQNNKIEITDCEDFTIEDLEYIIKEAKNFIEYKKGSQNGKRGEL